MHIHTSHIIFHISILVVCVLCTGYETFTRDGSSPAGWCYHKPSCDQYTWQFSCSSKYQSPINLVSNFSHLSNQSYKMEFPKSNQSVSDMWVRWMGITVQCDLHEMSKVDPPTFKWDYTGYSYKFYGLHLHYGGKYGYGSEHTLDGKSFPAEVHLVYYRRKYESVLEALKSKEVNAITVIAAFIETIDDEHGTVDTNWFEKITNVMYGGVHQTHTKSVSTGNRDSTIALSELFKGDAGGYAYTYVGSFTTPPCTPARWIVLRKPVVTYDHVIEKIRRFSKPWSHLEGENTPNNFRALQTARNRYVELIEMTFV